MHPKLHVNPFIAVHLLTASHEYHDRLPVIHIMWLFGQNSKKVRAELGFEPRTSYRLRRTQSKNSATELSSHY